jgi:aryl-alcohol dehydrogenase-like predicted oxidoreductase
VLTKCGTVRGSDGIGATDLRPEVVRRDVEESLRRLGTDQIDLLWFHDHDPAVPIEESWGELQRLVAEGKVRYGGLSNQPREEVESADVVAPVVALQHQLSLLARETERDVLPFARERGLVLFAWSPLASGFLVDGFDVDALDEGDFRRGRSFAQLDLAPLRSALRAIGLRHGATAQQVALAWVLARPAVAIVGVRSPAEVDELPRARSSA